MQAPASAIMEPVRVTADHIVGTPGRVLVFRHPDTGADVLVEVVAFQDHDDPCLFGIGAYVLDDDGDRRRGTVLRWDDGPDADTTEIRWQAPHCPDDDCGAPCAHRRAGVA